MTADLSERAFEDEIEAVLTAPPQAGDWTAGGYIRRNAGDYDRALGLIPDDAIGFILASQPREWAKYQAVRGGDAKAQYLRRLSGELTKRGALDVLCKGVRDGGCAFAAAYFRPESALNEDARKRHAANIFAVVRQLKYSADNENSIDLALFVNGVPLFTAELKNPLTGQNVRDAIRQYRGDRNPREPLLVPGRCLAHFAVDPDLVYVAANLDGDKTAFLPFNKGRDGGAGNPPKPPSAGGFAADYLWREIWARDSILDLIHNFIHEEESGKKTARRLIFPRYHQLDAVRRLIADARKNGAGRRYLIQHSAGSGKSNSIAWLAHRLASLHNDQDRRVFDSIIVVSDRRVLDRQLQQAMRQFERVSGVVENIDRTSRQLRDALNAGKTIIVTTLQKFPRISDEISRLPGKRFAVIVDEAHSSQTGDASRHLQRTLAADTLEKAARLEEKEDTPGEALDNIILAEAAKRGMQPNVSTFAFTATPKSKTLELFGRRRADGKFEAFSLYSMRQAIDEGFILDVLENYTTYQTYWNLLKTVRADPRYERKKAQYLLRRFVELHPHAIAEKIKIITAHFEQNIAAAIDGEARAMIVTRSRLHAVRYKRELDKRLRRDKLPYRALIAFSGAVKDGGKEYTEERMNGFAESQTATRFAEDDYRLLVVANKFQTGFDQPLLGAMYVDKKLAGLNAVQTLSRLNRIHPQKKSAVVLDFVNAADDIGEAFRPYYEQTLLACETDPNLLYEYERKLDRAAVYRDEEVTAFARLYLVARKPSLARVYAILEKPQSRFAEVPHNRQEEFRGNLDRFVRLYAFLSQILPFADVRLEKLYPFCRALRARLPADPDTLPREIYREIDMDAYRIRRVGRKAIKPKRGGGELEPAAGGGRTATPDEKDPLSRIIRELNERFGTDFTEKDKAFIRQLEKALKANEALQKSLLANPKENARLSFDLIANETIQEMVDSNFNFYKRITDDGEFGKFFLGLIFDRLWRKD